MKVLSINKYNHKSRSYFNNYWNNISMLKKSMVTVFTCSKDNFLLNVKGYWYT